MPAVATKPISDPIVTKKPSKDFPWWLENIDHKITPEVQHVLETYSSVRPEDVSTHIYAIVNGLQYADYDISRTCYSGNLFGNDIVNHWDLGYEFFNDEDRFHMKKIHGQVDIVSIVHVLHQWDWDTQVLACKELVKFSKSGSLKEFTLHDAETFQRMWDVVGEETGTKWSMEAAIVPWKELAYRDEDIAYIGSDFALLRFLVTRVR
ncbi:hypothetical protein EJ02DRAFT_501100 [Clathrospora elynae]|uniref:Methyltransferase type 11 domain-containing protein n=1 Tax=Clathrospora elynae TaxID=706981 RepID=A0A6A5SY51_9PLEO|nr:hypothetical protein EJ02DRAFT_501100 [Clathrospora elynae]